MLLFHEGGNRWFTREFVVMCNASCHTTGGYSNVLSVQALLGRGIAVASVDYRLCSDSPEVSTDRVTRS